MQWGAHADWITEVYAEDENPPAFMDDAVELLPGAGVLLAAFNELLTDRQVGLDYGPIPAMAIGDYADRHGLSDPDDLAEFRRVIRALEREYEAVKPKATG